MMYYVHKKCSTVRDSPFLSLPLTPNFRYYVGIIIIATAFPVPTPCFTLFILVAKQKYLQDGEGTTTKCSMGNDWLAVSSGCDAVFLAESGVRDGTMNRRGFGSGSPDTTTHRVVAAAVMCHGG